MSKKWPSVIIKLVFLIAFNIVFFLIKGFNNSLTVWVSYAFVHVSYIALLLTPCFIPRGKDADSVAYPLHVISWFYFILTLIACGVFMYYDNMPTKYSVITNVVLSALYLILFLSQIALGKKTQEFEEAHSKKADFINNCCRSLDLMKNKLAPSDELYFKIAEAYDLVHSSPVNSNNTVSHLEQEALSVLDGMQGLDTTRARAEFETQLKKLIRIFNERNTMLK